MRYNVLIGGKAGQGIDTLATLLSAALAKAGFYVFNAHEYESLIRGGHSYNNVCFSDKPSFSYDTKIDFLIALDELTYELHQKELTEKALIITSDSKLKSKFTDDRFIFVDSATLGRSSNLALLGAFTKILGLDKDIVLQGVRHKFKEDKATLEVTEQFYGREYTFNLHLTKSEEKGEMFTGSEALAQGALDAGVQRYFGYPMTPATALMTLLAKKQSENLFVFLAENEIAAINIAIGCSFAGKISMVGTSGGGFDLMTEALSMQGMMELPLVIHLAQRAGPSTGVPTGTSQADLNVALYGGHGEFPRVILAPGDAEETYEKTIEAFYLAEKFGVSSLILTDKHLLESAYTTQLSPLNIIIPPRENFAGNGLFKRNSYEHDTQWNTSEDPVVIKSSSDERKNKLLRIKEEASKFKGYTLFGKGDTLIIGFGSTKGAMLDALPHLEGYTYLHLVCIEPFLDEVKKMISEAKEILVIENNSVGQLADLISGKCAREITPENRILKFDARSFTPEFIIAELHHRKRGD